jgi:hypothetical protein
MVKASIAGAPGWDGDQETQKYFDPSWESSASIWLYVVPCKLVEISNTGLLNLIIVRGIPFNSELDQRYLRKPTCVRH